jgi:ABC-type transporter Mla maintaining outer membrane lipid asymmetry ATPase subunit MlaF
LGGRSRALGHTQRDQEGTRHPSYTEMIELNGLQKVIDQNPVIDIDVLTVESGEIIAVVGPVGSGRDILFDLLVGRTRPTVGTVQLAVGSPFVGCVSGL